MRFLSKKEKKELQISLPKGYEINPSKDEIKEDNNILYLNGEKFLIIIDKKYLPHLKSLKNKNKLKSVYVDKGAIPFIIKGADLMRPGISKFDENIEKDEIVLIKDEIHSKDLAIGYSLFSSKELERQERGKSVIIYHYYNDKYY